MPFEPREVDQIKSDVRQNLENDIAQLTNFAEGTFNDEFLTAYAEQIREVEIKALVAEFAGFVDLAGKQVTQADLDQFSISTVTPAEVNQYVQEQQLDELGKLVGESRFAGQRANGTVEFTTTSDTVEIEEGYPVGTEPDASGDFLQYQVDADGDGVISSSSTATVSPDSGKTTVTADIIASEVGTDYNVGVGAITYMPNPEAGVEAVENTTETTGGEDRQENPELRVDIKEAVFENSGGGTASGIEGYIENNASTGVSVELDEFFSQQPPYVDVVVDGGTTSEIETLIGESRPVGIEHFLVRPTELGIGIRAEVLGIDADVSKIKDRAEEYLTEREISDRFSQSELLERLAGPDPNIASIPGVTTFFSSIVDERITYQSGSNIYGLSYGPIGEVLDEQIVHRNGINEYSVSVEDITASSVTVEAIVNGDRVDLVRGGGSDFEVIDQDSDGQDDAIKLTGSTTPDDRTTMFVSYEHNMGSVTDIEDENGTTYTKNTDFSVVDDDGDGLDDAIDWSVGGSSPSDGDIFEVEYNPRSTFRNDVSATTKEKVVAATSSIAVKTYLEE